MERTPAPSASLLVVGFMASALGGVLSVVGTMVNAAEVVSPYVKATHPGAGWIILGMSIAVIGVITLAWGFYNLASGVDYLVQKGVPVQKAAAQIPAGNLTDTPAETT